MSFSSTGNRYRIREAMDLHRTKSEERTEQREPPVLIRGSVVHLAKAHSSSPRDLSPADGAVAQSGDNMSVYCAPCQRWVDCNAGIEPEVALERHRALIHED